MPEPIEIDMQNVAQSLTQQIAQQAFEIARLEAVITALQTPTETDGVHEPTDQ